MRKAKVTCRPQKGSKCLVKSIFADVKAACDTHQKVVVPVLHAWHAEGFSNFGLYTTNWAVYLQTSMPD